jgi:peptidoglycan/LPS O-acetylase OafA/YrhL
LWPAALVALWKRKAALFVVLSTLVLASFALSVHMAQSAPVANFFWPVSRFWELGAGCLLALMMERPAQAAVNAETSDRRFLDIGYNLLPLA